MTRIGSDATSVADWTARRLSIRIRAAGRKASPAAQNRRWARCGWVPGRRLRVAAAAMA